jgi:hypothetical protein
LCIDLVKRAEILLRHDAQRSLRASLNRDCTLKSLTEIFSGYPLQALCTKSLTKGSRTEAPTILQKSAKDLAHDLPQRSSRRELVESNLVSLLHVPLGSLAGIIFKVWWQHFSFEVPFRQRFDIIQTCFSRFGAQIWLRVRRRRCQGTASSTRRMHLVSRGFKGCMARL